MSTVPSLSENTAPDGTDLIYSTDGTNDEKVQIKNLLKGSGAEVPAAKITGTVAHEQGGLEADVSAYSGLVKITGGATSAVADPNATATTKGDLLVRGASALGRVAVGTNDQVLTADSAEASGVKWAASAASLATTKGDLLVRGASALGRVAIGTNDQVLTADSAEASGVKWADAGGGGGGKILQVLTTTTSTQASTAGSSADSNLSLSITPSSTSSKILVISSVHVGFASSGANQRGMVWIDRGGTNLTGHGKLMFYSPQVSSVYYFSQVGLSFLDSPSTTSATTYKIRFGKDTGHTMYIHESTGSASVKDSLTLLEIDGS
jgi:rRNA-processing protein FCF1